MPLIRNYSEDANQNSELLNLSQRVNSLEFDRPTWITRKEKGAPGGIAPLAADGRLTSEHLPGDFLELLGANLQATDALSDQVASLPPPPTLADLGGEPVGAEERARLFVIDQIAPILARLNYLEANYPTSHVHFWAMGNAYNGTIQKTWTRSVSGNNEFARVASVTSAAVGDTVEFQFPLAKGTYQIEIIHLRRTDGGIATLFLDGVQIGTIDAYGSSVTNVNRFVVTVGVPITGPHTFKAVVSSKNSASSSFAFPVSAVLVSPAPVLPAVGLVLINAGDQSSFTAADGRVWSADQHFTGGVRADLEAALGPFTVQNTQNQRIYKFERAQDNGTFTYSIPIGQPGTFTLKLLFAENYHTSAGQRVGTVSCNGQNLLSNFDIFSEAGGKNIALVKVWTGLVMPTNTVSLGFTNTLVNGIELVRTS